MGEPTGEPVVLVSQGIDREPSSAAFTIANSGLAAGPQVSIVLTGAALSL